MSKNDEKHIERFDVGLKIGVVGVGNAGNQVVVAAEKSNFNCYAINTSKNDLDDEIVNKNINSSLIGDGRGAGKIRSLAKDAFIENLKRTGAEKAPKSSVDELGEPLFEQEKFLALCENNDIIIVVGSTSGGTGSGICPLLCNRIKAAYPQKILIYMGILPKIGESLKCHSNSIECVNEMLVNNIPYMLFDLAHYEEVPDDKAYVQVANEIVTAISVIRGDYLSTSPIQMMDERDRLVLFTQPGFMTIYKIDKVDQKMLDQKSIQEHLIDKIKRSPMAPIQKDGIVKYMGLVINLPEEMEEDVRSGNMSVLTEYTGIPIDIYKNYAITNSPYGELILIMSGLTLPFNRLSISKGIVDKNKANIEKTKDLSLMDNKNEFSFLQPDKNLDMIRQSTRTEVPTSSVVNISTIPDDFK